MRDKSRSARFALVAAAITVPLWASAFVVIRGAGHAAGHRGRCRRAGPGWRSRDLARLGPDARARRRAGPADVRRRRALYIVGETFGGPGIREAAGWQDGEPWFGPCGTSDIEADLDPGYRLASGRDSAINAGLRALGVRARPGQDEYETIGLTRHRYTEGWARIQE